MKPIIAIVALIGLAGCSYFQEARTVVFEKGLDLARKYCDDGYISEAERNVLRQQVTLPDGRQWISIDCEALRGEVAAPTPLR